jgi:hypothetical protein
VSIYSISDPQGEPSDWKVTHFADINGGESFVVLLVMEIPELVDASTIYAEERNKLKEAIVAICVEGLMPAFEQLKMIRALPGQNIPELNRRQLYENFTGRLWHAYKDLMQNAAKMIGPDIGFLFKDEKGFEAGLIALEPKQPALVTVLGPYLRKERAEWQNDAARFRNYLEHTDDTDPRVFASRYEPSHADKLFDRVWHTIGDVLAMLISMRLVAGARLVEIPTEQRDPVRPRRFRFEVRGLAAKRVFSVE